MCCKRKHFNFPFGFIFMRATFIIYDSSENHNGWKNDGNAVNNSFPRQACTPLSFFSIAPDNLMEWRCQCMIFNVSINCVNDFIPFYLIRFTCGKNVVWNRCVTAQNEHSKFNELRLFSRKLMFDATRHNTNTYTLLYTVVFVQTRPSSYGTWQNWSHINIWFTRKVNWIKFFRHVKRDFENEICL